MRGDRSAQLNSNRFDIFGSYRVRLLLEVEKFGIVKWTAMLS
jgi:hypothetical protein